MTTIKIEVRPCGTCGAQDRYPSGPCRPCTNRRNRDRGEYKKAWARQYRAAHPEEARAADKVWRDLYRDDRRAAAAAWRTEHPDYHREWRAKNRESTRAAHRRWKEANPEKAREATARWRQANWPRVLAMLQRRRARKQGAAGTFTCVQARSRFDYFGGRCWMCGSEATCMDHVIALCNGGSNWPSNLRPACNRCNGRKGQWEMSGPKTLGEILLKAMDFPR